MTEIERKEMLEYREWADKLNERIPELASRVFTLRKKHYEGCGFHYLLEKRLGFIINFLNGNVDYKDTANLIVNKVIAEEFEETLEEAEKKVG